MASEGYVEQTLRLLQTVSNASRALFGMPFPRQKSWPPQSSTSPIIFHHISEGKGFNVGLWGNKGRRSRRPETCAYGLGLSKMLSVLIVRRVSGTSGSHNIFKISGGDGEMAMVTGRSSLGTFRKGIFRKSRHHKLLLVCHSEVLIFKFQVSGYTALQLNSVAWQSATLPTASQLEIRFRQRFASSFCAGRKSRSRKPLVATVARLLAFGQHK